MLLSSMLLYYEPINCKTTGSKSKNGDIIVFKDTSNNVDTLPIDYYNTCTEKRKYLEVLALWSKSFSYINMTLTNTQPFAHTQ